ncbi:MAG: hypothetical protein PHT60_08295 [Acidiphilium sp.]|nr:hypothetical protein [Acidiphilium sp.]MDD4935762.1 hypothetical protein [Acidiphilium sp.]
MKYCQLGRSGLKVSALTLGTMTMGGAGVFGKAGNAGLDEARRQIIEACNASLKRLRTDYIDLDQVQTAKDRLGAADPLLLGPHL